MQEKTFSNKNMYILVSKDFRLNAIEQNRITVHTKKDIIDKIILSMKTNFLSSCLALLTSSSLILRFLKAL